ncbi:MAG: polysaccharide biosynthesis C-terminal domain-containing protein [Clostridiaceae bacterium]|jgi:putative MATE family efflux protein|nr:polysaccharide biosynthesis C-terminal domain-containing protein [Clostridiaceae bacterium]
MHANEELKNKSVIPLLIKYSLTTFAALLLNSLYTLADALFVSWGVGADATGGVSLALPFVLVQSAISATLGGGAASIISRKLGEGKHAEGGEVAFNAMIVFWITAVLISVFGLIFIEPLLKVLGTTAELGVYAKPYLTIILIGNVFSTGFSSIIRAEGRMKYALLIWVIPITVNIVADALLILVFKTGVIGSAIATVVCQFISFLMSILFFKKFSCLIFKGARLRLRTVRSVVATGLPSLVQQGGLSLSLVLLNNFLSAAGGAAAIKTYAYINRLFMFGVIPSFAAVQAMSPLIGFNHGAGDRLRVVKTVRGALLISVACALLFLAVAEAFPRQILSLLTDDADVLASGAEALRIVASALPFMPFAVVAGGFYQSVGKKGRSLFFYAVTVLLLIPAAFFMYGTVGLYGIWWTLPVAAFLSAIISAGFLTVELKRY